MWTPRLMLPLLAVSALGEGSVAPSTHSVQRRLSSGFSPIPGYTPQQQHHHHGNGYGGGPGAVYPPPVYPHPHPYPGGGHHGGPYPPPAPHTSVHIEPEKIVLNCIVQGYSSTPIQWLKPAGPGLVAEGGAVLWDRRHLLVETAVFGGGRRSRLVISYPRPRHLGLYRCRAGGAASRAFRVGGGGEGGFQPVYHGRSGGSGKIQAREPGAEPGAEQEPGAEPELEVEGREDARSEPLTEDQKQEIITAIKREIQEVEDAVTNGQGFQLPNGMEQE